MSAYSNFNMKSFQAKMSGKQHKDLDNNIAVEIVDCCAEAQSIQRILFVLLQFI